MQQTEIWYGEECYLMKARIRHETEGFSNPEYTVVDRGEELDEEKLDRCFQFSFEPEYHVLHSKPKNKVLLQLLEEEPVSYVRVILDEEPDVRSAAFKKFAEKGMLLRFGQLDNSQLTKFLKKQLPTAGDSEIRYMIERMQYRTREGLDLYGVRSYTDRLSACPVIDRAAIDDAVPKFEQDSVFKLFDMIRAGRKADFFSALGRLLAEGEDEFRILSLMLRSYRLAYKAALGFSASEIGVAQWAVPKGLTEKQALHGMDILNGATNKVKAGHPAGATLTEACYRLF